jgi:hypothetical protein
MGNDITITSTEDVLITAKRVSKQRLPAFQAYGTYNGTTRHGIETVDFVAILLEANSYEKFVIKYFKDNLTWDHLDNELKVIVSNFTNSEKRNWTLGIKALKEKNLVASTRRGHYMMNPGARVPKDYVASKTLWNKATEQVPI